MTLSRSYDIALSLKVLKSPVCCSLLPMFKIIVEKDIKCIMMCDV